MKDLYKSIWFLSVKYKLDGSCYFDKILVKTNLVSVNNDMFNLKKLNRITNFKNNFVFCNSEMYETSEFFEDVHTNL